MRVSFGQDSSCSSILTSIVSTNSSELNVFVCICNIVHDAFDFPSHCNTMMDITFVIIDIVIGMCDPFVATLENNTNNMLLISRFPSVHNNVYNSPILYISFKPLNSRNSGSIRHSFHNGTQLLSSGDAFSCYFSNKPEKAIH